MFEGMSIVGTGVHERVSYTAGAIPLVSFVWADSVYQRISKKGTAAGACGFVIFVGWARVQDLGTRK